MAGSVAKIEVDRDQERGQKIKVVVEKSCQNKVFFLMLINVVYFFVNIFVLKVILRPLKITV